MRDAFFARKNMNRFSVKTTVCQRDIVEAKYTLVPSLRFSKAFVALLVVALLAFGGGLFHIIQRLWAHAFKLTAPLCFFHIFLDECFPCFVLILLVLLLQFPLIMSLGGLYCSLQCFFFCRVMMKFVAPWISARLTRAVRTHGVYEFAIAFSAALSIITESCGAAS